MNLVDVIYEDNHILVVNKPINVPVQADQSGDLDMLTILKNYLKEKYSKPGNVYLGLVHRLDRPVGGVMVFAKTSKAASRISDQIRKGEFKKEYLAIVNGILKFSKATLKDYLLKDEKNNISKVVDSEILGAKEAILDYEVIRHISDKLSLVKINLHTGRSHQIRLQFANIGYPLYGDQKYGTSINEIGQQLALWSNIITFTHPTLNTKCQYISNPTWNF